MPLVVDLTSSPDLVVVALGLNFSPDDVLNSAQAIAHEESKMRLLSGSQAPVMVAIATDPNAVPIENASESSISEPSLNNPPPKPSHIDDRCSGRQADDSIWRSR